MDEVRNFLTSYNCIEILQKKLKTKDFELNNAEWKPISDSLEGYSGEHSYIKLTYTLDGVKAEKSFFVKVKPYKSQLRRQIATNCRHYEKEIYFYHLCEEFLRMGYYIGFAPRNYFCKDSEGIVLEDLSVKGYKLTGKNEFVNLEHCKAALKSLAYFHANFMAYEETKSKELKKKFSLDTEYPEIFKEIFIIPGDKEGPGAKYLASTLECFKYIGKLLMESEKWKDAFEKKLAGFDIVEAFWTPSICRKTCGHGDLWGNNMLYKYSEEEPIHCILLDFQVMRYHYPIFDVLLILYSNTTRSFRKEHFEELVDFYYEKLEEILKGYGYDASEILPKDHFLEPARFMKPVALFQAAGARLFSRLPKKLVNDAASTDEGLADLWFNEKQRILTIDEEFKKNEIFRNIVTDDIYDLYDVL